MLGQQNLRILINLYMKMWALLCISCCYGSILQKTQSKYLHWIVPEQNHRLNVWSYHLGKIQFRWFGKDLHNCNRRHCKLQPSNNPKGEPILRHHKRISHPKKVWNFSNCLKSSFFVQKFNFDFPRKLPNFFGVKKSWKCGGYGLLSCWQLWFHEKNCQKKFGWKTRENVEGLSKLNFWTKIWLFE